MKAKFGTPKLSKKKKQKINAKEEGLRFQRLSIFENGGKNPSFFRIKNRGLSPRSKFFIHILVPKRGLEPLRIAPYAPETHVSTIPPLRHNLFSTFFYSIIKFFLCTQWRKLTQGQPSRKTWHLVSFSCGRVPLRHNQKPYLILTK